MRPTTSDGDVQDAPLRESTAGWYPAEDPARERWWDGQRWTEHVRDSSHPVHVRWAGIRWGGPGSPVLHVVLGALLLLVSQVALILARGGGPWRVQAAAVMAATFVLGACLLANAAVRWWLEARRTPPEGTGPPPEAQLAHVRRFGVLWGSGRGWSQRSLAGGSMVVFTGVFVGAVTFMTREVSSWDDVAGGASATLVLLLLGAFGITDGCFRVVLERRCHAAGVRTFRWSSEDA